MAERKVINKYYPPDFSPAKVPRRKQLKNQQIKVRMMLPCSICCKTCGQFIYKGTKFNSRKETINGETYLGIEVFRFYFRCTRCSAEISIKTNPRNSDYDVEFGATRNFEPWRAEEEEVEKLQRKKEDEEFGDCMKILEHKTMDSKREIGILDNLEEVKSMKARRANVSVDAVLEALQRASKEEEERINDEDEALVRSVFEGKSSKGIERRIADEDIDDDDDDEGLALAVPTSKKRRLDEEQRTQIDEVKKVGVFESWNNGRSFIDLKNSSVRLMRVSVLKKPLADSTGSNSSKREENKEEAEVNSNLTSKVLESLCQNYESDQD